MEAQTDADFVLVHGYGPEVVTENGLPIYHQSPEVISQIKTWLQPTDYASDSSEFSKHLRSRAVDTGRWLQQTETFHKWYSDVKSGFLWIKGIPGAGKSVFAATIADELSTTENVPVLYFFFRQIILHNHEPRSLVQDWLCQFLNHEPILQSKLKAFLDADRVLDSFSTEELWALLFEALVSVPKVYCIVDALDEMDVEREIFLNNLVELGFRSPSSIKVMVTSRPIPRIESRLKSSSVLSIRLDKDQVDLDIGKYVKDRLAKTDSFNLSDEAEHQIRDKMCSRSQGSFLYARLMMDKLLDEIESAKFVVKSPAGTEVYSNPLEEALQQLPSSLETMYDEMLVDHSRRSGVSRTVQLKILQLVTHSSRPLRLIEFASMFQVTSGDTTDLKNKAVLRTACGPLLEIFEDETISIIHHSFTEYLTDETRHSRMIESSFPVINKLEAHRTLASACLAYVTSEDFNENFSLDSLIWQYINSKTFPPFPPKMALRFPFADYAINFWHIHARMYDVADENIFNALDKLLESNKDILSLILKRDMDGDRPRGVNNVITSHKPNHYISNIHLAAYGGLSQYCERSLILGQNPDLCDKGGLTPMIWAARGGHAGLLKLLLKYGAQPDLEDGSGLKPLHYAARSNHAEVVKVLLEAGVDPLTPKTREDPRRWCGNAPTTTGQTPIQYACTGGCKEAVFEMMPLLSQESLEQALRQTIQHGHIDIVLKILEIAPSTVHYYSHGDTMLFLACKQPKPRIIRALLDNGADPRKASSDHSREDFGFMVSRGVARRLTPMHALAGPGGSDGHHRNLSHYSRNVVESDLTDTFQLLLNAGCSINEDDGNGYTPLHYAVQSSSLTIAQLLLRHGADVNAQNENGNTPLHLVTSHSLELAKLLIRNGADINAIQPKDGKTMLHNAMKDSALRRKGLSLLSLGPDCNIQDFDGNTPLHIACKVAYAHDTSNILDLLMAGASPNIRNNDGKTPIHRLATNDFEKNLWDSVVQAGGDLEVRDTSGNTILLEALSTTRYASTNLKLLLELGARPDACNNDGDNVLHLAAYHKLPSEVYDVLIAAGADPTWLNLQGDTILHNACKACGHAFEPESQGLAIEKILSLGVSPNSRNVLGQTPLHFASASSPNKTHRAGQDVVEFILKSNCNVNVVDHEGLTPIHNAATISEFRVKWLIDAGADITLCSPDGRSPLHMACRARQSNVVGLLLDELSKLGRLDMIDHKDIKGRTALHDSCRSGRPESVGLLLKAGANPNVNDNEYHTPLFACSEFEEEQSLWFLQDGKTSRSQEPKTKGRREQKGSASGMLLEDHERPYMFPFGKGQIQDSKYTEHNSARVFESIELLIDHGLDLSSVKDDEIHIIPNKLTRYVENVERFPSSRLSLEWENLKETYDVATNVSSFHYQAFREACSPFLKTIAEAEGFLQNRVLLLNFGGYDLIEDFCHHTGGDPVKKGEDSFLERLSSHGYYSIFEKHRRSAHRFHDQERKDETGSSLKCLGQLLLHAACKRALPNLDMIEVLIEKLAVNVNSQERDSFYVGNQQSYVPSKTALHVLAQADHWWQLRGMEFLLQHGAALEAKDKDGKTPLHYAINVDHRRSCWRMDAVGLLLRHGANPNAIDNNGLTCLHMTADDVVLTRMLIIAGADVSLGSRSLILSAIDCNNIKVVSTYIENGIDVNSPLSHPERQGILSRHITDAQYALQYVATKKSHSTKKHDAAYIAMTKRLLDCGANPYGILSDGQVVVHEIFKNKGTIQPFLDLPWLDLALRDNYGQNLLHVACGLSGDVPSGNKLFKNEEKVFTNAEKSLAEVFLDRGGDVSVVDNKGRTCLHILLYSSRQGLRYSKDKIDQRTLTALIGADSTLIAAKDCDGFTPMHIALKRQLLWAIELLLESGASLFGSDPEGNTALHYLSLRFFAKDEVSVKIIFLFKQALDEGVDINAKNQQGKTALSNYVAGTPYFGELDQIPRHFEVFKDSGADIFTRDAKGWTLLHEIAQKQSRQFEMYRREKQHEISCFQFFLRLGLDVEAEDESQRTCLDVAAACENSHILALFKR